MISVGAWAGMMIDLGFSSSSCLNGPCAARSAARCEGMMEAAARAAAAAHLNLALLALSAASAGACCAGAPLLRLRDGGALRRMRGAVLKRAQRGGVAGRRGGRSCSSVARVASSLSSDFLGGSWLKIPTVS